MTDPGHDRIADTFSEATAKQILARAAEIDAIATSRFTAAELQQIAAEATIQASAVELAMKEASDAETRPTPEHQLLLHSSLGAVGLLGIGVALGALAVTADAMSLGPESAAAVFGPSAAFTLYRALRHRWHGSLVGFLRELTVVFGSFTLTATAVEGFHATMPAMMWSLLCTGAGSGIIAVHLRARAASPSAQAAEAG